MCEERKEERRERLKAVDAGLARRSRASKLNLDNHSSSKVSVVCRFTASFRPSTMSAPQFSPLRCCARSFRKPSRNACIPSTSFSYYQRRIPTRRCESTAAAAASNPKISGIVDQISQLTLLETADLVSTLKVLSQPSVIPTERFLTSDHCSSFLSFLSHD